MLKTKAQIEINSNILLTIFARKKNISLNPLGYHKHPRNHQNIGKEEIRMNLIGDFNEKRSHSFRRVVMV